MDVEYHIPKSIQKGIVTYQERCIHGILQWERATVETDVLGISLKASLLQVRDGIGSQRMSSKQHGTVVNYIYKYEFEQCRNMV